MITNLAKSINFVLKKSRNLPIGVLVKSTYVRCNALFNKRGKEVTTMLASGQVYIEILNKVIEDALRKANTHNVLGPRDNKSEGGSTNKRFHSQAR